MTTRREFGKMVGTGALALGIGEISMGLSCANVFTDIENYVPIGLSAFQTVVSLVDPTEAVAVAGIIALVKVAFADLAADVTAYQNAPAANKATLLGKISTAISIAQAQIQTFWSALKLPDGSLATTISGLLGVILSTLAAFLPQLPPAAATPATEKAAHLSKTLTFTPVKRSTKQFRKDFDAILIKSGHADKVI